MTMVLIFNCWFDLCIVESWYDVHAFMVSSSDDEKRWYDDGGDH